MSRSLRQRRERVRRARARRLQLLIAIGVLALMALGGTAFATYDWLKGDSEWPTIETLKPQRIGENSIVFAADGSRMGTIQSDQNRSKIRFEAMGEWVPKATVAIEDQRFYEHNGVDPEGIVRALVTNVESNEAKQGASTITQQVVRNLYKEITTEKSLQRKAKEATLAVELEDMWSKKKILETYLNLVFYGHNAYGIEAASKTYFNKRASQLTIPEAALLAGLPQAPSKYDPFNKQQAARAKARRNDVLLAMRSQSPPLITATEYAQGVKAPIQLHPTAEYTARKLPYFFDYVEQDLIRKYGAETVRGGGLRIRTTIDPKMQELATTAIRDVLGGGEVQGAMAVIDTKTGEVRAMASSQRYDDDQFNRAARAQRQPGSTAKIWVLSAFIMEGVDPDSTTYVSRPIKVRYKGSGEEGWWEPKTYSETYRGAMSIRQGTLASDNTIYAQMTLDISPEKVAKAAYAMGVRFDPRDRKRFPLEPVWSIGLGSQVVTPLEQTNFYSTIARGGIRIDPRTVTSATTAGGTKLKLDYPKGFRVLKDWQAGTLRDILIDNVDGGGTGSAAYISGADVGGKTGTTDDAKDAWFCGVTPELTACVWIGYNIPTPMYGETGGGRPAQIWRRFMEPALQLDTVEDRDWFEVTGEPTWVPWNVGQWMDNPSLDVVGGYDPSYTYVAPAPAEDADATVDTPVAVDPTPDPVAPAPDPVQPKPDPVAPAPNPDPVAPAPDPAPANGAPQPGAQLRRAVRW